MNDPNPKRDTSVSRGFAELPHFPADRIRELSNNDLLHMIFGVAT